MPEKNKLKEILDSKPVKVVAYILFFILAVLMIATIKGAANWFFRQ